MKKWFARAGVATFGAFTLLVPIATPALAAGGLDPSFGTNGTLPITGPSAWTLRPKAMDRRGLIAVEATRPAGPGRIETGVGLIEILGNGIDPQFNDGKLRILATGVGIASAPAVTFRGISSTSVQGLVLTDRGLNGFQVDWVDPFGAHLGTGTFQESSQSAAVVGASDDAAVVCYTYEGRGRIAAVSPGGAAELVDLPDNLPPCRAMVLQNNNQLLIAGHTAGHSAIVLVRTDLNGNLDTTFGTDGVARIARPGSAFQVGKIAVESDGIYVAGMTQETTGAFDPAKPALVAIHKLTTSGKPAPTWGTGGLKRYQLRNLLTFDVVAFQKFMVGGIAAHSAGTTEYRLFRGHRGTGLTDGTWGTKGGYIVPPSSVVDTQSDGSARLLSVGYPKGKVATIVQRRYGGGYP